MSRQPATKMVYPDVTAKPVKSFFVTMLTRDISLSDAILDLLDNCVDGILRQTKGELVGETPYEGYWAHIEYDEESLTIDDNCGGIPWDQHDYAFRLGRANPDQDRGLPTVGAYGIGMKRAIFKLGREALISTQNGPNTYEIDISPKWISDEDDWSLKVRPGRSRRKSDGTTIVIGELYEGIAEMLGGGQREAFTEDFRKKVASHYAFIINKGFQVKLNRREVKPKPTSLVFVGNGKSARSSRMIRPYIYRDEIDGVKVFLMVGLTQPIPSLEEIEREAEEKKYSSLDAGWTVVCNDRAVLYCDRSELTGWGEAGVPRYHTQFIAISGIAEFVSDEPAKLPMTTTKRGLDTSSRLYLQVKNRMREGLKLFTDFTNRWKGRAEEAKRHVESGRALSLPALKGVVDRGDIKFSRVRTGQKGEQFVPALPIPHEAEKAVRKIAYWRKREEIRDVGRHLLSDPDAAPSRVGERCFDEFLREARRE